MKQAGNQISFFFFFFVSWKKESKRKRQSIFESLFKAPKPASPSEKIKIVKVRKRPGQFVQGHLERDKKSGFLAFGLHNENNFKIHSHKGLSRKITLMEIKDGSGWLTTVDQRGQLVNLCRFLPFFGFNIFKQAFRQGFNMTTLIIPQLSKKCMLLSNICISWSIYTFR